MASSALNRQLLLLEEELGIELFERLPRGIRPTAAGEILLAYKRQWDRDTSALRQEMAALRGGVRGIIRLAAAETTTECILPRAMASLRERFPHVNFSLVSGDNHRITSELLARDVDIVLVYDLPGNVQEEVVLTVTSPIGVIVQPDHPLCRLQQITLGECAQYPLIAPGKEWLQHSGLRALFSGEASVLPVSVSAERPGILKSLVCAGLGIGFMTALGVEREVEQGSLVWIPLAKGIVPPSALSVVIPKGRMLPHYSLVFLEVLKGELQKASSLNTSTYPAEDKSSMMRPPWHQKRA